MNSELHRTDDSHMRSRGSISVDFFRIFAKETIHSILWAHLLAQKIVFNNDHEVRNSNRQEGMHVINYS